MDMEKPWYFSRTIWASLVVILATLAGGFGLAIDDVDMQATTDAILQAVTALAALIAILGRLLARSRIG
ncbi:hypothetical protein [Mesorhizobium sp. CAU 1732]|uniref:hypothetical protein n=1 Tax=Mesorhizobium sp. CAU 1732 TaxID=3140358 RepID=UPI003260BB25